MEWWVFPALVLCAVTFLAAAGVLVFLAARGVWRLLARYEPAHAAGPSGERWVPWDTDPRFGSMQLDADQVWADRNAGRLDSALAGPGSAYPLSGGPGPATLPAPPLDWREVAHEGDWRAQTAADLAPATLDSGPGDPSLAPGPDLGELPGLHEWHDHAPLKWGDEGVAGCPSCEQHWECPEPEAVHTVAGRLVETSDEWLRRLVADARKVLVPADELPADWQGWTWAGTVAA